MRVSLRNSLSFQQKKEDVLKNKACSKAAVAVAASVYKYIIRPTEDWSFIPHRVVLKAAFALHIHNSLSTVYTTIPYESESGKATGKTLRLLGWRKVYLGRIPHQKKGGPQFNIAKV